MERGGEEGGELSHPLVRARARSLWLAPAPALAPARPSPLPASAHTCVAKQEVPPPEVAIMWRTIRLSMHSCIVLQISIVVCCGLKWALNILRTADTPSVVKQLRLRRSAVILSKRMHHAEHWTARGLRRPPV